MVGERPSVSAHTNRNAGPAGGTHSHVRESKVSLRDRGYAHTQGRSGGLGTRPLQRRFEHSFRPKHGHNLRRSAQAW